jgi:hypothetical protein
MPEQARVVTTDAEIDAAIRQVRLYEKYDQRVVRANYSERTDRFLLRLEDGVTHIIPRWLLQGLSEAEPGVLNRIELLGRGTGLYWPALDVAHSVSGLLCGVYGSAKWMKFLSDSKPTRHTEATALLSGRRSNAKHSAHRKDVRGDTEMLSTEPARQLRRGKK